MDFSKLSRAAKSNSQSRKPKSQTRKHTELGIITVKKRQTTGSRMKRKIILSVNKDTKKPKAIETKNNHIKSSFEFVPKIINSKPNNLSRSKLDKNFIMCKTQVQKAELETAIPISSLFSLLLHFNLQQYYGQLIALGFEDHNPHIQLLKVQNRRKFTNELSLMPGHNNRFLRMFSNLEKSFPREESNNKFCGQNKENSQYQNLIFVEKYTDLVHNKSKNPSVKANKIESNFSDYFGIRDFCGNSGSLMVDGRVAAHKNPIACTSMSKKGKILESGFKKQKRRLFRNINSQDKRINNGQYKLNLRIGTTSSRLKIARRRHVDQENSKAQQRTESREIYRENRTSLSHFIKQTWVEPKLIQYTLKTSDLRSRTRSPQNYCEDKSIEERLPVMFENQKCKQVIRQLKESIKDIDVTQKEEVENIMVDKKLSEDPDEQEISEQTTPSSKHSAIINTNEKKKAIEFGYSLDKRMSKCTPIYNDLHKACFALSQVIFRHIKFSRGMLFLEDLAKIVRNKEIQGSAIKRNNDINNKIEFTPSKNILKFNYCFNENLKFDLSVAQPKYLLNRVDTVDEIRKELTFEPRNDSIDQFASNNFIKFNLSDSEDEDPYNQKENKHQPFSFKNSQDYVDQKINDIKSVIHEEKDEQNESRNHMSMDSGSFNSQFKKINLLAISRSSPSLASNNSGGLFKLHQMQSVESNIMHANNEENVFKKRGAKITTKSSEELKLILKSQSGNSSNDPQETEDIVPMSPDARMKRKRRQRACEIANNPLMLRDNNESCKSTSSPAFSNGENCIKMNLCFNKSEESEYNPEQSYRRPRFEYDYTPYESIYKVDEREGNMKKLIEAEAIKFDQQYSINNNVFMTDFDKASIPTFNIIYEQIKSWTSSAKMESEIPVISLIYIERLMKKAGILINENNWARIVMITLCVASKIWDDDSLENEHFAKVLNGVTLKEISILEKVFLGLIDYEVMVTNKQFAKYSFILSSFINCDFSNISSPQTKKPISRFESERVDNKFRSKINKA